VRVYQFRHFGSFGYDFKNQKLFTSSQGKLKCSRPAALPPGSPLPAWLAVSEFRSALLPAFGQELPIATPTFGRL
jgi:hypothetical protein